MKDEQKKMGRRVILVYWKTRGKNVFEIYSNLKNFVASYPEYSYNTLSNYLSKDKKPFENDIVRVERMPIFTRPVTQTSSFRMIPVIQKRPLHSINEEQEDFEYWLSRSPQERLAAVTFIIFQSLKRGSRMDKSIVVKRKMKP